MAHPLFYIEAITLTILGLFTLTFILSSIWERERRAVFIGSLIFIYILGIEILLIALNKAGYFQSTLGLVILLVGLALPVGFLLLLIRIGRNQRALEGAKGYIVGEVKRVDERDIVFARGDLRSDSEEYRAYYRDHPELEARDALRRKKGIPLGTHGSIDQPNEGPNIAKLMASFSIPLHLSNPDIVHPELHPTLHGKRLSLSPEEATLRVKGFAKHLGADLVGVTEINPLWVYSNRGRSHGKEIDNWGEEIDLSHRYAIVFAMEMDRDMVWAAPHTTTVIESGHVYAKGAFIGTALAAFIANIGYPSTTNHLRYYEALLVPLAIDAGLGELGRLGFLVTKEFGPRIRLGCVTTDLPLIPDQPVDIGVEDFCRICKKCAHCCPSRSIPFDDLEEVNGTLRWQLNADTCFAYWAAVGTDCNICMRVCPWSHPGTLPHRLISELSSRNYFARRIFITMDDVFYGKEPKVLHPPDWAAF